uniref:Uncharacterized protein n=1 Tax=Arundo donax TaxID=35708 RepID=A0A0A8ZLL8_ARUDO
MSIENLTVSFYFRCLRKSRLWKRMQTLAATKASEAQKINSSDWISFHTGLWLLENQGFCYRLCIYVHG